MAHVQVLNVAGPSRLPRPPTEIIDVDALPDEVVATRSERRQRPQLSHNSQSNTGASSSRHSSVIYVLDSDEEDAAAARRPHGVQRHRFFSPPPPVVYRHIPPVPPIPRRFAHLRQRAHSGQPPPAIVPNADPFPFEAQIDQPPQHHAPRPVLPPRGASRSHHQPVMGLGGALIALNRQNAAEEENRQRNLAQRAAQRRQRFYPFSAFADALRDYFGTNEQPAAHVEYEDYGDWLEPAWENHWDAEWLPEGIRRFDAAGLPKVAMKAPAWVPSYTHPGEPGHGFSFDFDPKAAKEATPTVIVLDDDDSSGPRRATIAGNSSSASSVEVTLSLVCARCLDPLALSGQEGLSLSPEESRKRRVWALRCGHMLDGKCIDELMRPDPPVTPAEEKLIMVPKIESAADTEVLTGRGKGKARAIGVTSMDDEKNVDVATLDIKGKGKAVDRRPVESSSEEPSRVLAQESSASSILSEDTSIRSRLRPRPPRSATSSTIADPDNSTAAPSRITRPLPRRRGNPRAATASTTSPARPKGKGRARKPVVADSHEWFCPVSGCCRLHLTVRMRGEEEWKMDDSLGAIALFI